MAGWRHILKQFYPWALWVGGYFLVIGKGYPEESIKSVLLKIMPILSLAFMVLATTPKSDHHQFRKRMTFAGLLFSAVGDVFMVWINTMMMQGAAAFACAHLCYITGFGFKPRSTGIFILCMSIFGGVTAWIFPFMSDQTEKYTMPIYLLLLCLMLWRATSFFFAEKSFAGACACFGGYAFIVSDVFILVDKFVLRIKDANMWIMLLYYVAQLGIAFSVSLHGLTMEDPVPVAKKRSRRARYTSK